MIFIWAIIIPILGYILQSYPRLFNRYFGVDVWTLLIEIDIIRKNKHFIPKQKIKNGFIIDGYFDYPPLFLIILSFIPKKLLFSIQGFISPLIDNLLNIFIFFITFFITNNLAMALIAQLVYAVTPVTALENSALLPRSLGYSFFMLTFFSLISFTAGGSQQISLLIISVFLAGFTLLTHKFATQSFFFISIFFSIFERNPIYILVFIAGVIISIVLSGGYYLKVIKSHIGIINFWIKNRKYRFAHQIYGNISVKKNPDLIGIIYKLLIRLAPITLLSANPWIIASILYLILQPVGLPIILFKMAIWILFFYCFSMLVLMIPSLTPIGEGYRYIEMTTLPSAILTSYMLFYLANSTYGLITIELFIVLLLITLLTLIFLQRKAVINDKTRSLTNDMDQMFEYINKVSPTPRIMCIPHQITTMTIYNSKANVLVNFDVDGLNKMHDFYPVIKKPILEIVKKYKITHILLRESFAKIKDLNIKNYKVLFRRGDTILIDVSTY